jgi:hypothetical protein
VRDLIPGIRGNCLLRRTSRLLDKPHHLPDGIVQIVTGRAQYCQSAGLLSLDVLRLRNGKIDRLEKLRMQSAGELCNLFLLRQRRRQHFVVFSYARILLCGQFRLPIVKAHGILVQEFHFGALTFPLPAQLLAPPFFALTSFDAHLAQSVLGCVGAAPVQ